MIRLAEEKDFAEIMETFAYARRFMAENGNPSQWGTTFERRGIIYVADGTPRIAYEYFQRKKTEK